jgi:fatty-acid desaturase
MSARNTKIALFIFQLLAHIALVAALFLFSFADWGISFFVYFLTGCLGVSITFHRLLSHKSWKAPKWFVYVGSLFGFYGLIGSPIAWANNHIAHHKYTDTDKDPHSPKFMPWWKVQWLAMFTSYDRMRFATSNPNAFQIFLHRYYFHIHTLILVVLVVFFSIHAAMVFYLVPAAILWNMSAFINTINHSGWGYRNFDTPESSVNNLFTGYFIWGEGWHNNHHAYPGKSSFQHKPHEIDISSYIIKVLEKK